MNDEKRHIQTFEHVDCKRVLAFLTKTRGLEYKMVVDLVKQGKIAQEEKTGNVLFKYFDENGLLAGVEKVGTLTDKKFKGIAPGSASDRGFEVVRGKGEKAYFFESSIDMLSYLQMHKDIDNCRLVSIMGLKPDIVMGTVERHNISPDNVYICTDNDEAGNRFYEDIAEENTPMENFRRIKTPENYKDWNDMLRGIEKEVENVADKPTRSDMIWFNMTNRKDMLKVSVNKVQLEQLTAEFDKYQLSYAAVSKEENTVFYIDKKSDSSVKIVGLLTNGAVLSPAGKGKEPLKKYDNEYTESRESASISLRTDLAFRVAKNAKDQGIKFTLAPDKEKGKLKMTFDESELNNIARLVSEIKHTRMQLPKRIEELERAAEQIQQAELERITAEISNRKKAFAENIGERSAEEIMSFAAELKELEKRQAVLKEKIQSKVITQSDIDKLREINPKRVSVQNLTDSKIAQVPKFEAQQADKMGKKSAFEMRNGVPEEYENSRVPIISVPSRNSDFNSVKTSIKSQEISRNNVFNVTANIDVQISRRGLEDTLNYASRHNDTATMDMLYRLDEIVANAAFLDTKISEENNKNKAHNTVFMHNLYSVIKTDDQYYLAKLAVEEFVTEKNKTGLRLYNLQSTKIEPLRHLTFGDKNRLALSVLNGSDISITDLRAFVKTYYEDFYENPQAVGRQERLEEIEVNRTVDKAINSAEKAAEKEMSGLFRIEQNGEVRYYKTDSMANDLLKTARSSQHAFIDLSEMGSRISEAEYAEIEQSDRVKYSAEFDLDRQTADLTAINKGKGGIAEGDRRDSDIITYHHSLKAPEKAVTHEQVQTAPEVKAENDFSDLIGTDKLKLNGDTVYLHYFNEDGNDGKGQFVEVTFTADDIAEAVKAMDVAGGRTAEGYRAFTDYISENGSTTLTDNGTEDFEADREHFLNGDFDLTVSGADSSRQITEFLTNAFPQRVEEREESPIVEEFRARTDEYYHEIDGLSAKEIETLVSEHAEDVFRENSIEAEIKGVALVGSRSRGIEHDGSDIDVVIEVDSELKEDALFNILHENTPNIGGFTVDVNPIRAEQSGTLEEYLPKAEEYLRDKAKAMEYAKETGIPFTHAPMSDDVLDDEQDIYTYDGNMSFDDFKKRQLLIELSQLTGKEDGTPFKLIEAYDSHDVETAKQLMGEILSDTDMAEKVYSLIHNNTLRGIDAETAVLMWKNGFDVYVDGEKLPEYDVGGENWEHIERINNSNAVRADPADIEKEQAIDSISGQVYDLCLKYDNDESLIISYADEAEPTFNWISTQNVYENVERALVESNTQFIEDFLNSEIPISDELDGLLDEIEAFNVKYNVERADIMSGLTANEKLFLECDIVPILAKSSLAWDEIEDLGNVFYNLSYVKERPASDKAIYGNGLHEPDLYALFERQRNGGDISEELVTGLLGGGNFYGRLTDSTERSTFEYTISQHDEGYTLSYGNVSRDVSFKELESAYHDLFYGEWDKNTRFAVYDFLKDDIPEITEDSVDRLIDAFDGAKMHGWESGDNQAKINRIKKALNEVLGDEGQTEKAFDNIAKHRYGIKVAENEPVKEEPSLHFGSFGNGITAYDTARIDPETNDYLEVAHISEVGTIKLWAYDISAEDMERIKAQAQPLRDKFMSEWNKLSVDEKYNKIVEQNDENYDIVTAMNIAGDREKLTKEQAVEKYTSYVMLREGERPEEEPDEPEIEEELSPFAIDKETAQELKTVFEEIDKKREAMQQERVEKLKPTVAAEVVERAANSEEMQNAVRNSDNENQKTEAVKQFDKALTDIITENIANDDDDLTVEIDKLETLRTANSLIGHGEEYAENIISKAGEISAQKEDITAESKPLTAHKVGSFYEFYDEDSEIVSNTLNINRFPKSGHMMSGFPDYMKQSYTDKLAAAGYAVKYEEPMDRAIRLINEFCEEEYESPANFSNLDHVDIAYTTDEDTDVEIQVYADLETFRLVTEYGGKEVKEEIFDSVEDMCVALENLDFGELTSVSDEIKGLTAENDITEKSTEKPFWEETDDIGEQLSLFGDSEPLNEKKPRKPIAKKSGQEIDPTIKAISNDMIHYVLRCGSPEQGSLSRIVAQFQKGKSDEENAVFLQTEFGNDGRGYIYISPDTSKTIHLSSWFDDDGIKVTLGDNVDNVHVPNSKVPWLMAARQIKELLESGRYCSQEIIDDAADKEISDISEKLWYLHQDTDKQIYQYFITDDMFKGGFPDSTERIKNALYNKETLQEYISGLELFVNDYEQNRDILRFHFHKPKELLSRLKDLQLERIEYKAAPDFSNKEQHFISEREIDALIGYGGIYANSKFSIEEYFTADHTLSEKITFLKDQYGIGGTSKRGGDVWHDAKGITYMRGEIGSPDSKITLKWNEVAERIERLISGGNYITQNDIDYLIEDCKQTIKEFDPENSDEFEKIQYDKAIRALAKYENGAAASRIETEPEQPRLMQSEEVQQIQTEKKEEKAETISFTITDEKLGSGNARAKYNANIEAIKTLKSIEAEKRAATA